MTVFKDDSDDTTGHPWITTALSSDISGKMRKLLAGYALTMSVYGLVKRGTLATKSRIVYTIAIHSDDVIYNALHQWLLKALSSKERRALIARTERENAVDSYDFDRPERRKRQGTLSYFYDAEREHRLIVDGHHVTVSIEKPDRISPNNSQMIFNQRERLVFKAYTQSGRDILMALLAGITDEYYKKKTQPAFYMVDRYSGFEWQRDMPARPLDTVILAKGQKERIVNDLTDFLGKEDDYNRLGIPWHRGYLLEGPPGGGKTSISKALANEFDLDVYYIPLTDLQKDVTLFSLFSQIRPRSILLLEDVDILHASTSREDKHESTSLSGLLNALDGVGTPHGLITIMTTNDMSKLDPALVRPGRVDVTEHIGMLDDDQLCRLYNMVYGKGGHNVPSLGEYLMSPAEAIECFKRNPRDPLAGMESLTELIKAKVE